MSLIGLFDVAPGSFAMEHNTARDVVGCDPRPRGNP
jgi:hypothetical protein